jgi:hypothetical protein
MTCIVDNFKTFKLIQKEQVTHNTARFGGAGGSHTSIITVEAAIIAIAFRAFSQPYSSESKRNWNLVSNLANI